MRISCCILPIYRWRDGGQIWRRAESLGFHAAYTYGYLSWHHTRATPWFGPLSTLAVAAATTQRIRLGTLVSAPHLREPIAFAKELMTIDDLSDGRLTVGLGAGAGGVDATVLGSQAWSPSERTQQFTDFVALLDKLLTEPAVSYDVGHYWTNEAHTSPGCVQQPRPPFAIAATGPRGMRLAARYGQAWVARVEDLVGVDGSIAHALAAVRYLAPQVDRACMDAGRDPNTLERVLLATFVTPTLANPSGFLDTARQLRDAGITELVMHWPRPTCDTGEDLRAFEHAATRAMDELG